MQVQFHIFSFRIANGNLGRIASPSLSRAIMASPSFRSAERRSSLRSNIFLLECAVVLFCHVAALHHWARPGPQRVLLSLFAIIYMGRLNLMARWLLPRELALEEVTFVSLVWVPSILASFTYGAVLCSSPASSSSSSSSSVDPTASPSRTQLVVAAAAYFGGSFLNTFSELQRKWWKAQPQNKGRCYTQGLFSLSRNINYFGDVVLFGAWAAATAAWWKECLGAASDVRLLLFSSHSRQSRRPTWRSDMRRTGRPTIPRPSRLFQGCFDEQTITINNSFFFFFFFFFWNTRDG